MNERTDAERTGETLSTADLACGQRDHEVERQDEHAREATGTADNARASVEAEPLFAADDARGYQQRWQEIQTRFVDEPKDSVRGADSLVAEVVQKLTVRFAEEREGSTINGAPARRFLPKTCARLCSTIVHFSSDCYRHSIVV